MICLKIKIPTYFILSLSASCLCRHASSSGEEFIGLVGVAGAATPIAANTASCDSWQLSFAGCDSCGSWLGDSWALGSGRRTRCALPRIVARTLEKKRICFNNTPE